MKIRNNLRNNKTRELDFLCDPSPRPKRFLKSAKKDFEKKHFKIYALTRKIARINFV
jgi:hypothetical protein